MQPEKSIVGVTVEEATSSGVTVAPGLVVTCFHVVKPPGMRKVSSDLSIRYEGREYPATILRADPGHDLCLLEVPGLPAPAIAINSNVTVGEPCRSLGMPSGHFETHRGLVEHLNRADDHPIIFSSARTQPGFSGGALVNAGNELIGIPALSTRHGALPAAWVEALLARFDRDIRPSGKKPRTECDYHDAYWKLAHRSARQRAFAEGWVKKRPESFLAKASYLFALGGSYLQSEEARHVAQAACAQYPCTDSYHYLIETELAAGHAEAAVEIIREELLFLKNATEEERRVAESDACISLTEALHSLSDDREAEIYRDYFPLFSTREPHRRLHQNHAYFLQRQGRLEDAATAMRRAIDVLDSGGDADPFHLFLADIHARQGNYREAIACLCRTDKPDHWLTRKIVGLLTDASADRDFSARPITKNERDLLRQASFAVFRLDSSLNPERNGFYMMDAAQEFRSFARERFGPALCDEIFKQVQKQLRDEKTAVIRADMQR